PVVALRLSTFQLPISWSLVVACWAHNGAAAATSAKVAVASSILFMAISWPAATHCILSKSSDASALLRTRGERPRRAAEQRYELAPFQLIELHWIHRQPGPDCRVSNGRWSVRVSGGERDRPDRYASRWLRRACGAICRRQTAPP